MYTVGEEKFSRGSIVYINRHSPAPSAPPPGSSEATILEYDRANLWVANVLEVRAKGWTACLPAVVLAILAR